MILVFFLSFLWATVRSQTTLPSAFTWPFLNLSTLVNITQNISLNNAPGTSYLSMDTNDYYVSRLTTNGKLQIFDMVSNTLNYSMLIPNQTIISYDLVDNDTGNLSILLDNNTGCLYSLGSNGAMQQFYMTEVASITTNPRYAVQFITDEMIMSVRNPIPTTISRRNRMNNFTSKNPYKTDFNATTFNIKVCIANPNDNFVRVAMWKRNCYVSVLKCSTTINCNLEYLFNNTACDYVTEYNSTVRDYFKLSWNNNCGKILFESKNQGLKIVNFTANITLATFNVFSVNNSLNGFWFLDDFDQFVGVSKPDGTFLIYNTSSQAIVDTKILPLSNIVAYSSKKRNLFVTDAQKLYSYKFGCQYPNLTFQTSGLCSFNSSYQPPVPVSPNPTPSPANNQTIQPNSSHTNQVNQTNQSALNETTANSIEAQLEEQILIENNFVKLTQKQETPIDQEMNTVMVEVMDTLAQPIQYTATAMTFLPFTFLYMRFINFWSICSMYKIARIRLPQLLGLHLLTIYDMVSASMFQHFGWEFDIGTRSKEKFQEFVLDHGFSSNLIKSNVQNFATTLFSYFLLGSLYFFYTILPEKSFLKKNLHKFSFKLAFAGQFVGIMNSFIFNFPVMTKKSEQDMFDEKINLSLQHFFFASSLFVSCLVILIVNKNTQNQKDKDARKNEQLNWFFDTQCNCLLPLALMLEYIPFFLVFNSFFFCIPIYTAWKQKKFRVIKVIKSLYLQIFNTGIILLVLFDNHVINLGEYAEIKGIVTLCTTCIMGVGALHEALELILSLLYEFFRLLCFIKNKVTNYDPQDAKKKYVQNSELHAFNQVISKNVVAPLKNKVSLQVTGKIFNKSEQINSRQDQQKNDHFISKIGKNVKIVSSNIRTKFRLDKFKKPISGVKTEGALEENLKIIFGQEKQGIDENRQSEISQEAVSEIQHTNLNELQGVANVFKRAKRICRVKVMKFNHWFPTKGQHE